MHDEVEERSCEEKRMRRAAESDKKRKRVRETAERIGIFSRIKNAGDVRRASIRAHASEKMKKKNKPHR